MCKYICSLTVFAMIVSSFVYKIGRDGENAVNSYFGCLLLI